MRFQDAVKLKPFAKITFIDSRTEFKGCVVHVTPRGGIKVMATDSEPWDGPVEFNRKNGLIVRWVHYKQVA